MFIKLSFNKVTDTEFKLPAPPIIIHWDTSTQEYFQIAQYGLTRYAHVLYKLQSRRVKIIAFIS